MPISAPSDGHSFIEEYLQGDRSALQAVDAWIDAVLRGEFRSLRGDWEDLKQEIRIRVFRNLSHSRFDGRSSLRTYVHRIAKNVCIDASRLAHRRNEKQAAGEPRTSPGEAGDALSGSIAREILSKVVVGLTADDRRLIDMVFREHCSYAEVAQRLGISEGAVKTRMSRCKDRLVARGRRLVRPGDGRT